MPILPGRVVSIFYLAFSLGYARAQQAAPPPSANAAAELHETHREPEAFEAEFVASNIFRSGSYYQPVFRGLSFEGNYFGGQTTDVAFLAGSWTFRLGKFRLSPGVGVLFGTNRFATSPGVSIRWEYEHGWFVTQGLALQGFRESPVFSEEDVHGERHSDPPVPSYYVRPKISDGNHFSAQWKRVQIGGTFEHVDFREGSEWKGGGRLSVRVLPRVSAILYVLGPGKPEWRGGILVHSHPHQ